jgi:hypothetical protein
MGKALPPQGEHTPAVWESQARLKNQNQIFLLVKVVRIYQNKINMLYNIYAENPIAAHRQNIHRTVRDRKASGESANSDIGSDPVPPARGLSPCD